MPSLPKTQFAAMSRQLATMVKLRLPLVESLDALGKTCPSGRLRRALRSMKQDVESGLCLSESAGKYPKVFPKYWRSLVAAGEKSDQLDKFLMVASEISHNSVRVRNKLSQALVYPVLVIFTTIVIFTLFVKFIRPAIWPEIEGFYSSWGFNVMQRKGLFRTLSTYLRTMMITPETVHIFILFVVLGILGFVIWMGLGSGFRFRDRLIWNFPLWGQVVRKGNASMVSRSLGLLLNGGVPLPEALEYCAEICPNRAAKDSLLIAQKSVLAGDTLARGLDVYPVFSESFLWAIHGMEKQGTLASGLQHLAGQMEFQTQVSTRIWIETLNPVLIFILGLSVCWMVAFPAIITAFSLFRFVDCIR